MNQESTAPALSLICSHPGCKNAGAYTLPGSCTNCGRDYMVTITRGHDKPGGFFGALCPHCGCNKVGC